MLSLAVLLLVSACGSSGGAHGGGSSGAKQSSADADLHAMLPAGIKASGVLKVGVTVGFPPYDFYPSGTTTLTGFDPDLGKAMADLLGVRLEYTNVGFASLIPGLQAKRFDIVFSGMADTGQREQVADFVDYYQTGMSMISKKNGTKLTSQLDLCGKTVAVTSGTLPVKVAAQVSSKCISSGRHSLRVVEFPDNGSALLAVKSGRANVQLEDATTALYEEAADPSITVARGDFGLGPVGVAVPKSATELRDAIQKTFQQLYSKGTYGSILKKWKVSSLGVSDFKLNAGVNS